MSATQMPVGGLYTIVSEKKDPVTLSERVPENERSRYMRALIAGRPIVKDIPYQLFAGRHLKAAAMHVQVQWICVDQIFFEPALDEMYDIAKKSVNFHSGSDVSDTMLAAKIFTMHYNRNTCSTLMQTGQGDTQEARSLLHESVSISRQLVDMLLQGDNSYSERLAPFFPSDFEHSRVLLWYALINLYKCHLMINGYEMFTPDVPDDETADREHLRISRQIMSEFPDRCLGPTALVSGLMADFQGLLRTGLVDGQWAEIVSLTKEGIRLGKIDDDMLLPANYWNLACATMCGACGTEPGPGNTLTYSRADFEDLVAKAREAEEPLKRMKRGNASDAFTEGKENVEPFLEHLKETKPEFTRLPILHNTGTSQSRQELERTHGPLTYKAIEIGKVTPAEKCFNCGLQGPMNKCARCKQTRYCSKECQTLHWHAGHNTECNPNADKKKTGGGGKKKKGKKGRKNK